MFPVLLRKIGSITLASILGIAATGASGQGQSFKVTISSLIDMDTKDGKQKIDAETELYYTWKQTGHERVLIFDSLKVVTRANDKEVENIFASKEKYSTTRQGKTTEVLFADGSAPLKEKMKDSFGAPICKIQVDENQKELKREIVAGPGAKTMLEQGIVSEALLFHPPFPISQNDWFAPAEISMGNGGFAKGDLHYSKMPGGQTVVVKGTLKADKFSIPGRSDMAVRSATYVVTGEQNYDPAEREWVIGNAAINVSFEITSGDNVFATANGKIITTFKKVQAPGQP